MNGNARIRLEQPSDHQQVENLTREAFYNVYRPGCVEHYLVRVMRGHADFIPELAFVLDLDGRIIGNIMYTRATLAGQDGSEKHIVTFGPVSIAPAYQRQGYGAKLIRHSLLQAKALGYEAVVIIGSPANYVGLGFKCCKKYNVCTEDGRHPAALLVCELVPQALGGQAWVYRGSPVMAISEEEEEAQRYDDALPPMQKAHTPSQEEFYILSQATLD